MWGAQVPYTTNHVGTPSNHIASNISHMNTYETSSIINTHKSPSISTSIPVSSIKNGSKTHPPTRPREPPGPLCLPGCHQCPCKATRKAESSPKELPLPAVDILGDTQKIIHTWRFCGSYQTWHMVYGHPSGNANPHPAYDSLLMDWFHHPFVYNPMDQRSGIIEA